MKKIIIPALISLFLINTACNNWTELDSLKYYPPTVEEMNPAEYENYLAGLRTFKATDHKVMILTMEGTSEYPVTQAQLPMAMPDSADYICIKNSSELHEVVAAEIKEVKEKKGTRVVSYVDNTITDEAWRVYSNGKVDAGEPAPTIEERKEFYRNNATEQLAACDKYGFDGVMISYVGNNSTEESKASQEAFMGAVKEWNTAHPEHLMFMRGNFNNVTDKELRAKSKYFIIVMGGASGAASYKSQLRNLLRTVDEKDRNVFEIMVPAAPGEEQVGDSPYEAAETILSDDVANYEPYKTLGLCVSNAADDYFTSGMSFANIRPAINSLNGIKVVE